MPVIINGTTGVSGVDGSAGTPSYQGTDSNTGIFYPTADTIAFAEGGAESMRIDSSGRLLIGSTSASGSNLLQVTGDATISGLTVGKGGGAINTNTAVGASALAANTTGIGIVAVGRLAATSNTTGLYTTSVGEAALRDNTTGNFNTAVGNASLVFNTTGAANTAFGQESLRSNTTASNNTAVGYQAGFSFASTGTAPITAFGYQSAYTLNAADPRVTAIGYQALYTNNGGGTYENTAVGWRAAYLTTTGSSLVAVGNEALYSNTTGLQNTAVGYQALALNTSASSNNAIGYRAFYNNTTGVEGVAIGLRAGISNTTGSSNTFVGNDAGNSNTTGAGNTFVGREAGYYCTTGSGNTLINPRNSANSYQPVFALTTENNRFICGSNGVTNAYIQVAWTVVSDERDKTNIADVPHGLSFVQQLKPVSYQFKKSREDDTPHGNKRYGFLAQDILALEGEDSVIIDNEDSEKLRYNGESLVPVQVKAIQELKAEVDSLKAQLNK